MSLYSFDDDDNDYLENLSRKNSETKTLNGAKAYNATGNACLDLFAIGGGMRYRSAAQLIRMFDRAYIEEPEAAMKLLFHIRDIREGMGERRTFRRLIRHVAKTWPESAKKNVHLISEFGRFDDLLCLLGTDAEPVVVETVRAQLDADLAALEERKKGNRDAHISLLAKWMPSANTSSKKTCEDACRLAGALGMTEKEYRKTLSALRANICLTERYLSKERTRKVKYSSVPAGAMFKYRSAFERNDGKRFGRFIEDVKAGKATLHADTLYPYEIFRPIIKCESSFNYFRMWFYQDNGLLELLWDNLPRDLAENDGKGCENAVCVVDVSGSMYWQLNGLTFPPVIVSMSLGLYHAERCKGIFHNHIITFEDQPHLIEIHGETLVDKLSYIASVPFGQSTNLEAVFDLLLDTAVDSHASQEDMPSKLYIISDMEFNRAVRDPDETVYRNAEERFAEYGYRVPAVAFINVNSWTTQVPVRANQKGAVLMSGMGVSSFRKKFDGNSTPLSHMRSVLFSDRYKEVHA